VALDWDPGNRENDRMNEQLLDMGLSLALSDFSELHLVHAWQLEHESFLRSPWTNLTDEEVDAMVQDERKKHEDWLQALVTSATEALGDEVLGYLKPEIHLLQGPASHAVPRCVRELGAELVVMGTVARTGIPGFIIGNTAERILTQLDCSVLAMKPEGFVSPITA
jgi:nucleotide-binding universal stress UspA family protein